MRSARLACAPRTRARRSTRRQRRRSRRSATRAAGPTWRPRLRERRRAARRSTRCRRAKATRRAGASSLASREQRLARIIVGLLLQLLEQLALALLQLLRHLDLDAREQVAAAGALQLRRALALHAQQRPVLRAGLDLHRDRAVRGRHLDGRTERGLRERDRDLDDQVVASALVQLRRLDARDDVEVARLAAREAGLTLALQADAGAVLDAGRDLDRVALRPALAPGAAAAGTRVLDHGPVAMTARAGLRQDEESLALRHHTTAVAFGADLRRRAGLRARAVALRARRLQRDRDLRLDTLERVLEGEIDLHLDVAAALGAGSSAARPAAEDAAEEIAEVAEVADVEVAEVDVAALEAAAPVRRAEGVVLLALLRIGEQVVGALDFLESLLGRGVARITVRVVLARELAVGLLDLVGRGALCDAQDLVRGLRRRRGHSLPSNRPRRPVRAAGPGRRADSPSARPRSRCPLPPRRAAREAPRARVGRTCHRSRSRRGPPARARTRADGPPASPPPRA